MTSDTTTDTPELTYGQYTRERHEAGCTDAEQITESFIELALLSDDPAAVLSPLVRPAVAGLLHALVRTVERKTGSWDKPPTVHGTTTVPTPLEARQVLLHLQVNVVREGRNVLILWSEITVADIDATVDGYHGIIQGVTERIAFLSSAKRLMLRAKVRTLGDVGDARFVKFVKGAPPLDA